MNPSAHQRYRESLRLLGSSSAVEAIPELQRLWDDGYVEAAVAMGWAYANGSGVERSIENAERWYNKGAQQGDRTAQYYLACLLLSQGRVADAATWLQAASERGHLSAKFRLGRLYQQGSGVQRDEALGLQLVDAAAAGGHLVAQRTLAVWRLQGHGGLGGMLRGVWWFVRWPLVAYKAAVRHPDLDPRLMGHLGAIIDLSSED